MKMPIKAQPASGIFIQPATVHLVGSRRAAIAAKALVDLLLLQTVYLNMPCGIPPPGAPGPRGPPGPGAPGPGPGTWIWACAGPSNDIPRRQTTANANVQARIAATPLIQPLVPPPTGANN